MYWSSCLSRSSLLTLLRPAPLPRSPRPRPRATFPPRVEALRWGTCPRAGRLLLLLWTGPRDVLTAPLARTDWLPDIGRDLGDAPLLMLLALLDRCTTFPEAVPLFVILPALRLPLFIWPRTPRWAGAPLFRMRLGVPATPLVPVPLVGILPDCARLREIAPLFRTLVLKVGWFPPNLNLMLFCKISSE